MVMGKKIKIKKIKCDGLRLSCSTSNIACIHLYCIVFFVRFKGEKRGSKAFSLFLHCFLSISLSIYLYINS